MANCSVNGCAGWVSGGFQEVIGVGNFENPHAEILGLAVIWCDAHKEALSDHSGQGYYLSEEDARAL
jgi:hypothetical protein